MFRRKWVGWNYACFPSKCVVEKESDQCDEIASHSSRAEKKDCARKEGIKQQHYQIVPFIHYVMFTMKVFCVWKITSQALHIKWKNCQHISIIKALLFGRKFKWLDYRRSLLLLPKAHKTLNDVRIDLYFEFLRNNSRVFSDWLLNVLLSSFDALEKNVVSSIRNYRSNDERGRRWEKRSSHSIYHLNYPLFR